MLHIMSYMRPLGFIALFIAAFTWGLDLAHFMPPVHVLHREAFEPLAKEIEQSTKGDLTIKIFPAGQLGAGPVQQYKRAIDGVADISFVVVQYVSTIFPRTMLLTLPGVADSAVEATEKAWRIYEPLLKSEAVFSEALDLLLLLAGEL